MNNDEDLKKFVENEKNRIEQLRKDYEESYIRKKRDSYLEYENSKRLREAREEESNRNIRILFVLGFLIWVAIKYEIEIVRIEKTITAR
jgi:intein-encoded DNA endonuclease-like protein